MPGLPPTISNDNLLDLTAVNNSSLSDLFSIFDEITSSLPSRVPSSVESSPFKKRKEGHLLILDKSLSPRINALTSFSKLRESTGIGEVIWLDLIDKYQYDYRLLAKEHRSFVIMLDLTSMDDIINVSRYLKERQLIFNSGGLSISLIFVDSGRTESTKLMLESQGIWGDLRGVYHWNSGTVTILDNDIVTLDINQGGLKQLLKYESVEPIESMAHALLQLVVKSNYKVRITNLYLKGDWSIKFWKIYQKLYKEHLAHLTADKRKIIEDQDETLFSDQFSFFNRNVDLVCLDRGVDLVSCLMTQLSYAGLCDEVLGCELGVVKFDRNATKEGEESHDDNPVTVKFGDPSDEIYPTIRDLNLSMVGSVLNTKARQLQSEYDRRNQLKDINEMKQFVGELNHLKELQSWVQKHTSLAERIVNIVRPAQRSSPLDTLFADDLEDLPEYSYYSEFIELQQDILADNLDARKISTKILDLMYKYEPSITDVLKLLALTNIVKKGIRDQEYNTLKSSILNAYGIHYLPLFIKLLELKIIYPHEPQLNFLATSVTDDQDFGRYQLIKDFRSVAYNMNLLPVVPDQDLLHPREADFALPGYVPLIARLVEAIYDRSFLQTDRANLQNERGDARYKKYGWDNLSMSELNGEVYQELLVPENKRTLFSSLIPPKMSQLNSYYRRRRDMIIVALVGGLTYSEIATIRFVLSKNEITKGKQLVILTTGIIRGDDLFEALV